MIQTDMLLAQAVVNDRGDVLLQAGSTLTRRRVQHLAKRGILSVYVREGDVTDELVIRQTISDQVRGEAMAKLDGLFAFIAERSEAKTKGRGGSVRRVIAEAERSNAVMQSVLKTVSDILNDILTGDLLVGMSVLKSTDGYAFQHGIDVAVTSALIGRKLWMPEMELRQLVAGSLVIDIGNLKLPRDLLNREARRSEDEEREMRHHTTAGFELLTEMGWQEAVPRHIPFQHHERQDGSGYPRGLRGTNRAVRSRDEARNRDLILPVAEVAAVADVFDALTSDQPRREAASVEEAIGVVSAQAGTALNREVVETFLSLLPRYALGMRVRLIGAPYDGAEGIVVEQDRFEADRPVIRLSVDGDGQPSDTLVQTVQQPDLSIRSLQAP